MNREEVNHKLEELSKVEVCIFLKLQRLENEIDELDLQSIAVGSAIDYLIEQRKILDLVYLCNTGKYPS